MILLFLLFNISSRFKIWKIQEFQIEIQKFKNFESEQVHKPAMIREKLEKEHSSEKIGLHCVAVSDSNGVF